MRLAQAEKVAIVFLPMSLRREVVAAGAIQMGSTADLAAAVHEALHPQLAEEVALQDKATLAGQCQLTHSALRVVVAALVVLAPPALLVELVVKVGSGFLVQSQARLL